MVPVANELAAYYISLIPSAKGLTKNIAKEFSGVDAMAERSGKTSGAKFSGAFKAGMAGIAGAFAAAGIGSFVGEAVTGAGKIQQSIGAIDSVFKGSAKDMHAWSKDAATSVGLSANEFNELGTLIGSQLKNGGTAMDDLAPKTKSLIGMGADLSSMFGGTTKEAIEAMSSALRGETDPIERYGVSLTAARVEAKALEQGATKVNGELSQQAKQAAILALITEQTADAQGNFARESDTFAQKQQVMSAKWEDLKTKIGEQFLPVLTKAFSYISDTVIPAVGDFRDGLAAVGQWVKDNSAWLIPLTTAVAGYAAAMGTLSIISTVRGWVAAATLAQWGLNAAMSANPIGLIVGLIAGLVAGLVWFFTQTELGKEIVANVWGFIQGAVKGVVDWFTNTALPVIQDVFKNVGAVFSWLYENIIKPVWNGITTVIGGVWAFISGVFNLLIAIIKQHVVPVFQQIWHTVQQVFNDVKNAIMRFWYTNVKPIFDAVVGFLQRTFGPAFDYLGKLAAAVWRGLYEAVYKFWYQNVKPVFDTIGKAVKEALPKAFEQGVSAVKKAWDKIQEIAKAPVRFVINTVINDGLIAGFNNIARPLGVKELGRVALPAGFANGGYTGPGGKYQPAGIVHAGEYVFTKEQTRRAGVGNLAAMASALDGYAKGGIVNPLKQMALTQGYNRVHKGIDLAAAVGTPVFASQGGRVTWAGPGVQAPGVWGGNEIHIAGGGIETWFAHLSQIGVKLGQQVRAGQQIGLSGNTGISSGPHLHFGTFAGGWPNDIDPLAYLGGAGIPSGGGFNPIAGIIDGLMSKIKEAGGGPFADIAIGIGKKVIDGASKFVTDFLSGNTDKKGRATATLYDGGGWLENTGGAQLVQHNKRKPDAVLSSGQWETMTRIADNAKGGFSNYGTIHVRDEEEMARIITTRQRDAQAAYGF